MKGNSVYLAGSIGGISYGEATEWRDQAFTALAKVGITAYSPMRAKSFLKNEKSLTWMMDHWENPMATSKGIMSRDHNDCVTADVLLVNLLGQTRGSLGTVMEIAWAFDRRIPVVMVAEPDNTHVLHPMLIEAINFRVDNLEDGIEIVKHILLPEVPRE